MPGFTRNYPVMEIAISADSRAAENGNRRQEGDVVAVRRATNWIAGEMGSKERHRFIWLRGYGLEEADIWALTEPIIEGEASTVVYEKRRYAIPLERLAVRLPEFNVDRARDGSDLYQPFILPADDSPHRAVTIARPLQLRGLVFDKHLGRYL